MLEELTLKNFKLFDEEGVTIRPGLVTVLIGPNGTGKSSVFQALGLLKQSLGSPVLKLDGPYVYGDPEDFYHRTNGRHSNVPRIKYELSIMMERDYPPFFESRQGTIKHNLGFLRQQLDSHRTVVKTEGSTFLEAKADEGGGNRSISPEQFKFGETGLNIAVLDNSICVPFYVSGRYGSLNIALEESANALCQSIQETIGGVYLIPALRGFDRSSYQQLQDPVTTSDLLNYKTLEERARAVATILLHERDIEEKISTWVSRVTSRTTHHKGAPAYHVAIQTSDGRVKFNLVHEGFGTNQLVYAFTQTALSPAHSLVCIDEPEIHLHPAAQAELSFVLVDIASKEEKPIILTTHSEHILMGLVTAVAQGKLKPEELAVYYFSREGDTARAERLEVTEQGQIKGGLKGFFEVEIEEMQRYMEALSQKNPS